MSFPEQRSSVRLIEAIVMQAASFALKKYVKEYWSAFFPTYKGPVATSTEVSTPHATVTPLGLHADVTILRRSRRRFGRSFSADWLIPYARFG